MANIVNHTFCDNGLHPTKSSKKAVILWNNGRVNQKYYQNLIYGQKINHFPNSYLISRKDYMFINMMKIKQRFKKDFNFIPNSFLLP